MIVLDSPLPHFFGTLLAGFSLIIDKSLKKNQLGHFCISLLLLLLHKEPRQSGRRAA